MLWRIRKWLEFKGFNPGSRVGYNDPVDRPLTRAEVDEWLEDTLGGRRDG
jgi:hypothetical protein